MKKLIPNVKNGGKATNIGGNLYYMSGRKHSAGGIDIGDTLEVEGGEVVQTTPKEVKVFSAQPILNGKSPAKLVMGGANPANVFNAQERFKDMNGLNDDGTTKFACGGHKKKTNGGLVSVNGNVVNRVIGDISFPSSTGGRKKAALGARERDKYYVVMNGKFYRQTNDEFGDTAYEPVDDSVPNSRLLDGRGNAAPRRRSTNRTSTTPTAAKPTAVQQRTAPNFASLDSMMQGLPTASRAGIPNKLESPVAANQNVPDIINSPKKRLALFDNLDTSDIIGLGSNLAGTIAGGITTNRALNRMEAPTKQQVYEPVMEQANKLKTTFNINPQLGEITEQTRRAMEDIGANTSSSRASLRGKQRARNASQYAKNNLYGQKENIETQLINQDRMNRQQVASRNTAAHNDYINRKSLAEYDYANKTAQFNNSIREQKASSLNRTFSGINAGIQDMVSRIENRRNYKNTLGIYDATHPNTDRRLFTSRGVKF